ncbi:hypothetical protein [Tellurirhabdus bombi]|uniref:hypothetical protein n=1 Tax=Tellurirhabdus bombi TaxID=2907205 RepID=UPI001F43E17C|nr:hypothetical protein [Tellurirhabdus bombi]
MPAIDKELKKEILRLPQAEKDKLLLRLVAKDRDLVERFHFVLIEEESTTEERRLGVRERIAKTALGHYQHPDQWMLRAIRALNSEITHHVKITKDKYGEVDLGLYLINSFFDTQPSLLRSLNRHNEKTCAYLAKRAESILKKLQKLDPDYFIEFETEANRMLKQIHESAPGAYARQLNLPKQFS